MQEPPSNIYKLLTPAELGKAIRKAQKEIEDLEADAEDAMLCEFCGEEPCNCGEVEEWE